MELEEENRLLRAELKALRGNNSQLNPNLDCIVPTVFNYKSNWIVSPEIVEKLKAALLNK
jgi:hypothetical protein